MEIPETGRQVLDADIMREWAARGIDTLTRHRRGVDELNVFPVADSDTATNMVATLQAAFQGATPGLTLEPLLDEAAGRALLSARGNSGVILAQMLRGLADVWNSDEIDAKGFAAGLRSATDAATAAVAVPTAGTILTVAEAAASAAGKAAPFGLVSAARAAAEAAAEAVAATPGQLPALARAGVVDAGGLALTVILEALVETLTGSVSTGALDLLERHRVRAVSEVEEVPRETGSEVYGYEVQYLLEANAAAAADLRHRLTELGDSVVIIGSRAAKDVTTFNVHVHVNDIGAAIEAGIERGRVHRISVTRFDDTLGAHAGARMHAVPARHHAAGAPTRSLVVVTAVARMREFLADEGCRTATSATVGAELAAAIGDGAASVVVLADSPETAHAAHEAVEAARSTGAQATVLRTITVVQAVAAVAVHDPERRFDDDVTAMAEAIRACRTGELRSETEGIAVVVGEADFGVFDTAEEAARDLADRLCADGAELLTVLPGAGSNAGIVTALSDHVSEAWPLVEIQQLPAGDDEPLLLLGAE
ncbi:DAK2 domain-containing protein [Glycomyces algeriensis]|uniref:Dihydroxyacetone kinase n=1 Tax=Glycomyces algeriensis TaxID=256037 RepID=A0A9W6LIX9_9ACTN|nr:DAK2 domain-containing protein [Glycomyces algeriensis]MDA1366488.1 DAK2 domain-containing protein [Glycomyces algeriensis]MDR7352146.1 DAK2 domain fusion protein YloV [Glycomyces algeriensis]GLI44880.1 dihydroxyacetone kinase [Glycomyces algeriensis]